MQPDKKKPDNIDKLADFIESFLIKKWGLFILLLTPYLLFSAKIFLVITTPDPQTGKCGNEFLGPILAHAIAAGLAAIILGIKLSLRPHYTFIHKIFVYSIIIVPPVLTILILTFYNFT
jgi:hypothetical protein